MTRETAPDTRKPALDEGSFQQLLAAAYVLQQHSDRLIDNEPEANPTLILSEIVEIQRLIESESLNIQSAGQIIAERLKVITSATGISIGIVHEGGIEYLVALGNVAAVSGSRIPLSSSASAEALRTINAGSRDGQAVLEPAMRKANDGGSFISVPFQHGDGGAGVVELRFQLATAPQNDIAAAQLMAGLMGDAIARSHSSRYQAGTNSQGAALADSGGQFTEEFRSKPPASDQKAHDTSGRPHLFAEPGSVPSDKSSQAGVAESLPTMESVCRSCGHYFRDDEYFCGSCGLPRFVSETADAGLQSKWASLWYLQQSNRTGTSGGSTEGALHSYHKAEHRRKATSIETPVSADSTPNTVSPPKANASPVWSADTPAYRDALFVRTARSTDFLDIYLSPDDDLAGMIAADSHQQAGVWISEQWRRHRAELYLLVAVVLFIVAVSGWGTTSLESSKPSVPEQSLGTQGNPPKPKLTAFEQLLVGLGLAEPPPSPHYQGNPDSQVWIDLHTALYYCPGADLYGATSKGRMTSQRSAQLDEFQPAERKPCD